MLPTGSYGKAFLNEKARLYECYTPGNPLEGVALKAVAVEHLLLQKPAPKSTTKAHIKVLQKRLELWAQGDFAKLLEECQDIQECLQSSRRRMSKEHLSRIFAKLVFEGKVKSSIRLLERSHGGVQELSPEVRDTLQRLHPDPSKANVEALLPGPIPRVPCAVFARISGHTIRQAALRTKGSGGVSGGDADHWRRQLTAFGTASARLCDALSSLTIRVCTEYVDPDGLEAFIANRLVALTKANGGTRPIGIGEIPRRIAGKAVMWVLKADITEAAGSTQLCAGQPGGCEAIIHAMNELFGHPGTEGLLLVDADNAFNSLNRATALRNIRFVCPKLSIILINFYRSPARLYLSDGSFLLSKEGTTQGCNLGMAMYALATIPLIRRLFETPDPPDPPDPPETPSEDSEELSLQLHFSQDDRAHKGDDAQGVQAWYADDAQCIGLLKALRKWWDKLLEVGPLFGYHPNPGKTYLIVKSNLIQFAESLFEGTGVVICTGKKDLGALIGCAESVSSFLDERVTKWKQEVETLAEIATTQPHAAHAAFTHALKGRWAFCQRTMQTSKDHMEPLEKAIRSSFIPALLAEKSPISDDMRELLSLPARHGGLGIENPVSAALHKFEESKESTAELQQQIISPDAAPSEPGRSRAEIRSGRDRRWKKSASELISRSPVELKRAIELAQQKGASSVFSTLPLERYNLAFKAKRDFVDLVRMRYRLPLRNLPQTCACGQNYSLDHSSVPIGRLRPHAARRAQESLCLPDE